MGDFHCLLDGELFLPESWSEDRERCRAAGIPDDVVYRPKWKIALELLDRARGNGVVFDWLTFDEGYGGKPEFLRELAGREQTFVAEVPKTFTGWIRQPGVTWQPFRRGRGRGRKTPRLRSDSRPAISVEKMLKYSSELRDQPWARYRVKDGEKGPMVWEVKHTMITVKDENDLPGMRLHLLVARNVLKPEEIKFFLSNAAEEVPVQTLLLVAFSRWRVERCFEDQKQEVGLDQWEGRRWLGLKRHLIITSVSYLFLARACKRLRGEKSGPDGVPSAYCRSGVGAELVA
jgi:SRSO17 transposase